MRDDRGPGAGRTRPLTETQEGKRTMHTRKQATAQAAHIDWWTTAGPLTGRQWWRLMGDQWWRPATRAEVEALRPSAAVAAVLSCDGATVIRSSMIPVAGGVPVRLWTGGPSQKAIYTVQATEYVEILREVETRLTEIAEQRAQ